MYIYIYICMYIYSIFFKNVTVNSILSVVIFHICQNKITIPKVESTVDIHRKILLENMSIKVHMKERKRRNRLKI